MNARYQELLCLVESSICVFCFKEIGLSNINFRSLMQECPHCTMPVLIPENIDDIQCYSCGHKNPLPDPLDAVLHCTKCGAEI